MTQYTKEFREQAILLSDEIGVKKAAEQLGVVYSTLVDWRKIRSTMRKKKQNVSSEPLTDVVAGVKLPKNAGEKFPLLGI